MKTTSLSMYVYYDSFIDDYSHKTWIYFLTSKDEVFERCKEFKSLVENLYEKKINILKLDNGGDSHQMNSMNTTKKLGLRGSSTFPIIHIKMVWQKEIIDLSWKLWKLWYMINIYQCNYGKKQLEQQYMYRIESPTFPLGTKFQKKCFPKKSMKYVT